MKTNPLSALPSIWVTEQECSLDSFKLVVEDSLAAADFPLATEISKNVPIYSGDALRDSLQQAASSDAIKAYMHEWATNFESGSGVIVIRNGYEDIRIIDEVTKVLTDLIDVEQSKSSGSGDHFAPAGANSRLWNAHEKLAIAAPELYCRYNANPVLALVCRSWLGPMYQMTAQVNLVRPGGQAQQCHRDYHLGFVSRTHLTEFPRVVHKLSAALTLQGAIAHCDMPIESGPTKLLPFSQRYEPGYIAAQLPEFRAYFEANHVQLALDKGDLLFFNPATFHAAGENRTRDVQRLANLLQIGSGFGRSIETVNTARICKTIYPVLAKAKAENIFDPAELDSIIAASAEGYSFPTNLDSDTPTDSMIPVSEQRVLRDALEQQWDTLKFNQCLDDQARRRLSH